MRENCESYENIHNMIMRFDLLGFLLKTIFGKMLEPLGNSADLLLERFVAQNAKFFREDKYMNDWLELIELGVICQPRENEPIEETTGDEKSKVEQESSKEEDLDVDMEAALDLDKGTTMDLNPIQ